MKKPSGLTSLTTREKLVEGLRLLSEAKDELRSRNYETAYHRVDWMVNEAIAWLDSREPPAIATEQEAVQEEVTSNA